MMINHEFRVLLVAESERWAGQSERAIGDPNRAYARGASDAFASILEDYMRMHSTRLSGAREEGNDGPE